MKQIYKSTTTAERLLMLPDLSQKTKEEPKVLRFGSFNVVANSGSISSNASKQTAEETLKILEEAIRENTFGGLMTEEDDQE